nr:T-cell activation Rho GTPase-activating protein-like [Columba livia]
MTAASLAICVGPNLLSPPEEDTLPLDVLVQVTGKVTQLVEFLIDHHEELFEEEEDDGLAGASAEELPAPEPEAHPSEVPPVTLESEHLNSASEERGLPGSSPVRRKRKPSCEEQSDGQPESKRRKLATDL